MTLVEQLRSVATVFARARRLSEARVSTLVFGDGKVLKALSEGSDITTRRLEHGLRWFSRNWPADAEWPVEVPRPQTASSNEGAAA